MIENVKIMEMIDKAEIIYEKTKSPEDTEIKEDKKFIKDYINIVYNGNFPVVVQSVYIRIVFKKNKIAINNVHLDEVAEALEANFKGVTCIYSSVYKSEAPVLRIYKTLSNEKKDIIPVMKDILHQIKKKDILIRGVPGIDGIITTFEKNVYPNPQTGEMEEKKQHMIVTSGSNLREILHMQRYIDPYRTHSNVVEEIHKELGYEAARKTIFMVLNEKFEEAKGLNSRHIEFITDIMTQNENILSFNRNGFKASNYGPIQKMFFEIPLTVINDSALYSKEDKGQSIESRQFTAKPMRGGTGICDVFYSPDEGKKKEIKEGGARENKTITAEMIDNLF